MAERAATWRVLADHLTPQQLAHMRRCDANPNHPAGEEGHRRGMLALAVLHGRMGPGGLN